MYEDTFYAAQDKAQLIPLNNLRKKMKYVKCVTGKIGFKTA